VAIALEAVAKNGFSEEARNTAGTALSALSDKELVEREGQKHVMLSCKLMLDAVVVVSADANGTDERTGR
jgi:hypothetical protein